MLFLRSSRKDRCIMQELDQTTLYCIHYIPITISIKIIPPSLFHHYTGTYNQNVKIIEVDTFTLKSSLSGHIGTISAISSSPDGRFAITSCYDGKARVKEIQSG